MKRTKVADLKAHLSSYLADVRAGASVLVCDRNTPVARLVPYEQPDDGFVVREARRPIEDLRKVRGVKLRRKVDVVQQLRSDRDQR